MRDRLIDLTNALLIALDAKIIRGSITVAIENFPVRKNDDWENETFYQVCKTEEEYKKIIDECMNTFLFFFNKQFINESEGERQILIKSIAQILNSYKFISEQEIIESENELYVRILILREQIFKKLKNLIDKEPENNLEGNVKPLKSKIKWNGTANEFVEHFAPLINSRRLYLKAIDKGDTDPIVKILHSTFEIKRDIGDPEEIKIGSLLTYFKNFNRSSSKK